MPSFIDRVVLHVAGGDGGNGCTSVHREKFKPLAGPDGAVQERQVRVMAVEPGRVRLRDVVRETELTVAVHRIVSVETS